MRMWNVNPRLMCRQHLLGEHVEMHMFRGTIVAGKSVSGYIKNGLVQLGHISSRHDSIALEMMRRGFNHNSPMKIFKEGVSEKVDVKENLKELRKRCKECRRLQENDKSN